MASVADARYVYNSRVTSWVQVGYGRRTTSQYVIYDDGIDSITNIQICYHRRNYALRRFKLAFSTVSKKTSVTKTAPSSLVISSNNLNTACKSVISPRYKDCITTVTQGYHSRNKTYTYMSFKTSAGRVGTVGRKHSSQAIKSYSTGKKTCLRGIFFNRIIISNTQYVGPIGFLFDTRVGKTGSTIIRNSTPMSPAAAAAIVVIFCCCFCVCIGVYCYQKVSQTAEAINEVQEIVEEMEKPTPAPQTAPHQSGPPPAYPPGQGPPQGYPGQMMPQQPMMGGGMMSQQQQSSTTTTTTQNQQMMQQ